MNCKPGDLAIVVSSLIPSNVGKIVHVVGVYTIGLTPVVSLDSDAVIWLCETVGSPLRWKSALGIEHFRSTEGPIPDRCLRPLRSSDDNGELNTERPRLVVA